MPSCLRNKECSWCGQPLTQAAKGHCGAIYDRSVCYWVPAIKEHGPREAIKRARKTVPVPAAQPS
jgi:hypothetical protein